MLPWHCSHVRDDRRWRRRLSLSLFVASAAWVSVSCRAQGNSTADPAGAPPGSSATTSSPGSDTGAAGFPAQVAIASSDLAVGRQRFAFGLLDAYGGPIEGADAELQFFQLKGEIAEPFAELRAIYQRSDLAPSGLYITYIDFPEAGTWGVEIRARLKDGREAPSQRVRFDVATRSDALGIGETPPPTFNRTLKSEPDLAKLTSDPYPESSLYQMTVDEAVKTGKPTVVAFTTPKFCESKICGPVLEEVKAVRANWADRANFIHIEVYKQFEPRVFADEMTSWRLATEPWVFVLDQEGKVAERLEGGLTAAELDEVLQRVVGGMP